VWLVATGVLPLPIWHHFPASLHQRQQKQQILKEESLQAVTYRLCCAGQTLPFIFLL
jgi:hypothetical protein